MHWMQRRLHERSKWGASFRCNYQGRTGSKSGVLGGLVSSQSYLKAQQSVCPCLRTQTPGWETPWSSVKNKTHMSTFITVWHWSQLITDALTPTCNQIHKTYCRLFTFLQTPTTALSSIRTRTPHITHMRTHTHTLRAHSQFYLIMCIFEF